MLKPNEMVSVIMPVYNRGKTIEKSIQSVFEQTYKNIELIIVDDYSNDDTYLTLLNKYKECDNVKVIKNDGLKGVSAARNCGIRYAEGEYIAFLDSDDTYLTKHIEESVSGMIKFNKPLSFALWYEKSFDKTGQSITKNGEQIQKNILSLACELGINHDNKHIVFERAFYEYSCTGYYYCYHIDTMVVKRELLKDKFLFNEHLYTSEDIDLILSLIYEYGFLMIMDYHAIYNQGSDNLFFFINRENVCLKDIIEDEKVVERLSLCLTNKIKMYINRIDFLNKHKNDLKMYDKCLRVSKYLISDKYFVLGIINQILNKEKACEYMKKSIEYSIEDNNSNSEAKDFIQKVNEIGFTIYECDMKKHNLF